VPHQRYEEQRLFRAYRRSGSARDREAAIDRFLPLARSLARRHHRGLEPLEDLEQVAYLALVKAVDAFDPSRGLAFTSFAVPTISGAIKRHFRDAGWSVRVPRDLQELALRVERATADLEPALGAPPTAAQVAGHLGVSVETVLEAREARGALQADSLDRPRSDGDGEDTLGDTLGDHDPDLRRALDVATLDALLDTLDARGQAVVRLYYQQELTQSQIGERLGVSQMHVSRLLRRALGELVEAAAPA
jgi:RNA polymerase sigma-B factor